MASLIRSVLVRCWQYASNSTNQGGGANGQQKETANKVNGFAPQTLGCRSSKESSQEGYQGGGSSNGPVPSPIPVCRFGNGEEFILTSSGSGSDT